METALYILHVLVCLAMLPIILLQSGKGGGVSAVFGGGGSGTVFGSRGASNFLTRMTTGAAVIFMCTSMALSYISSQGRSVVPDTAPVPVERPTGGLADEPVDDAPASGDQVERPASSSESMGFGEDGKPLQLEVSPPGPPAEGDGQ